LGQQLRAADELLVALPLAAVIEPPAVEGIVRQCVEQAAASKPTGDAVLTACSPSTSTSAFSYIR
jgi:hypothetical protein